MLYRPRDVASELGIAPSTLRLWSVQFASELSDAARKAAAGNSAPWAQRRYTEEDVELLRQAKTLLLQGLTYDEVKPRLRRVTLPAPTPQEEAEERPVMARALPGNVANSVASLEEALKAKDKTISTLKESMGFLEAYLRAVRQERDEAQEKTLLLEKELMELRARFHQPASSGKSWLKQVISGM